VHSLSGFDGLVRLFPLFLLCCCLFLLLFVDVMVRSPLSQAFLSFIDRSSSLLPPKASTLFLNKSGTSPMNPSHSGSSPPWQIRLKRSFSILAVTLPLFLLEAVKCVLTMEDDGSLLLPSPEGPSVVTQQRRAILFFARSSTKWRWQVALPVAFL